MRGWLHGNAVLLDGASPAAVDTGYHSGATELIEALDAPVRDIALTHVHSDHAGGVAALRARAPATVWAHADAADLVRRWDRRGLWLEGTSQELPRFSVDRLLQGAVTLAGRTWTVLSTPGHATGGVSLWCAELRVLVTGDALWDDGFGLLDPWTDGPGVFDRAQGALDALQDLGPAVVVPGHGVPFGDLGGALQRARSRLAYLRTHPERLREQIVRNCAGFLRLAHPSADAAELHARVLEVARRHPPTERDGRTAEELTAAATA